MLPDLYGIKIIKKKIILNKKNICYLFLALTAFALTAIVFFSGKASIFCDKKLDICTIESASKNKTETINYSNITAMSCDSDYRPKGVSTHTLLINTNHKYQNSNQREIPFYYYNKYPVYTYYFKFDCTMAISRFQKYQKSSENQFYDTESNLNYYIFSIIIAMMFLASLYIYYRIELEKEKKLDEKKNARDC